MMNTGNTNRPVLFFDGMCNLCNASVQFIIRHDKKQQFLFAPLQSEAGTKALQHFAGNSPDSLILLQDGQYFTRSSAALRVARSLSGLWPLLYGLIIIPPFLRDAVYNLIARNRYKWFGRQNACMMPTKELNDRFLK